MGKNERKRAFFVLLRWGKQKKQRGENFPQARTKSTETKKNNENEKKYLIYFFNCDILLIVKETETQKNKENKAFRNLDKVPRTNRTKRPRKNKTYNQRNK